jgi:hypothetical protein
MVIGTFASSELHGKSDPIQGLFFQLSDYMRKRKTEPAFFFCK